MTGYDADHPLTADDARVLTLLVEAQDAHDPMPPGLLERISLAVSLELMEAELAVLTAEALEPARADTPVDSITFTASSLSLMVTLTAVDDGVRIDGWVTGGPATVELRAGEKSIAAEADANGRFSVDEVPRGPVRFILRPVDARGRPVITPVVEI